MTPREDAAAPARAQSRARTAAVRALEAEFSGLLGQIQRYVAETAGRIGPGMMPGDYKVFIAIVRAGSITATALAEQLTMDKSQLSRTVHALIEHGLVERTAAPGDARVSVLSPTVEGLARLDSARDPQRDSFVQTLDGWDLDDIRTLTRLLRALSTRVAPQHD